KPLDRPGYGGGAGHMPWGDSVQEVPAECVRETAFDCVLYQQVRHEQHDRLRLLSEAQRALPTLFVEHDPPREQPTDTLHPVQDPHVLLVHVTPFNAPMGDNGGTPSRGIAHGLLMPDGVRQHVTHPKGVAVGTHRARRARAPGR
ncbi:glycosyltransferase family 1 protein, partial [Burkholderia cenocepacia]